MFSLTCEDCCYYAMSESVEYVHCCFREWGHDDYELAPCDDETYEDDYDAYEEDYDYEE